MTDFSGNVVPLGNITKLDIPSDRVLENAKGKYERGVVLLGWTEDGELDFRSSFADGGEVIWLLEKAKKALLEIGDE